MKKLKTSNRILKNASWIVGGRIAQSILSLVVAMFTARYLGPSNYGIINYAASLTAFFTPIMKLGLPSILVQELVERPAEEGKTLGSSLSMSFVSSLLCILGVASFAMIANPGERETVIVCVLYSILLVFQSVELIIQWFHAHFLSSHSSIAIFVASVLTSCYRIYILASNKSIYWFALTASVDHLILAGILIALYKLKGGPDLEFSFKTCLTLINKGKYYIVSGLMVIVFAQTDKIMIKMFLGATMTGYYSAAVTTALMSQFVFEAITDSFRAPIFQNKKDGSEKYEQLLVMLYSIVCYGAVLQCVFMVLFSKTLISILYGSEYLVAASTLRVVVWYTAFAHFGGAKDIWMLAENKQKYLVVLNMGGAISNILLNLVLIPRLGINGAAIASVITQFVANIGMCIVIKPLRHNMFLLREALNPKILISLFSR